MTKEHFILKRNLYENCRVRNLEGQIIFYCSSKRANWYLKRNLANVITEDPLEIQLNFVANGLGNVGDKFYLQHRKNLCVVCGTEEMLTRHHVIPYCFRKFLPDKVKNHSYHDILLLCVLCHEQYEHHANELKLKLAEEYDAPVNGLWSDKETHNKHKARGYAYALLKHADKIPHERKAAMLEHIKSVSGTDDLEKVATTYPEINVKVQGQIIVERLTSLDAFMRRWRQHFIDTMNPAHLPEHWDVSRGVR